MPTPTSAQPLFVILSALIEERAGLHYAPTEQDLFLERVGGRATEAGFDSLLDYYYYLRYDAEGAAELDRLLDQLVVNETFFFRELDPLQVLIHRFIAPWVREGRTPRIWSAACASGEEPLTLAILLAEAGLLDSVELVASDLSVRVLERAKAGKFGRRALRETNRPKVSEALIREEAGLAWVSPRLREKISWRRINLCDPDALLPAGSCDVVLLRNALIYFSDETSAKVITQLSQVLKPGGVLLVGISESLLRFNAPLICEELDGNFFYRKPK